MYSQDGPGIILNLIMMMKEFEWIPIMYWQNQNWQDTEEEVCVWSAAVELTTTDCP